MLCSRFGICTNYSVILLVYLCESWVENISNCTFTFLLVGNIEPSEAKSVIQEIENTIFNAPNSLFKSMSPSEYLTKRVIMLENELKCYYQTEGLNQKNENSSVIQNIQVSYVLPCFKGCLLCGLNLSGAGSSQASDFGCLVPNCNNTSIFKYMMFMDKLYYLVKI